MDLVDLEQTLGEMWSKHSVIPNTVYFKGQRFEMSVARIRENEKLFTPQGLKSLFPTLGKKKT